MKFNDLYNRVFVQEQSEVAAPSDIDVKPIPVPEAPVENGDLAAVSAPSNITQHVQKCIEFANTLQDLGGGNCLLSFVSEIDKPGTPFDGIQAATSSYIESAANKLRELSGRLASYTFLKK